MMAKCFIVMAITLLSFRSSATIVAPIELGSLYARVDFVYRVIIHEGRLNGSSIDCGAVYSGTVIKSFKGQESRIEFYSKQSIAVGGEYLIMGYLPSDGEHAVKNAGEDCANTIKVSYIDPVYMSVFKIESVPAFVPTPDSVLEYLFLTKANVRFPKSIEAKVYDGRQAIIWTDIETWMESKKSKNKGTP